MLTLLVKMGPHGQVIKTRLSLLGMLQRIFRAGRDGLNHIKLTSFLEGYRADNEKHANVVLHLAGPKVELSARLEVRGVTDEYYSVGELGLYFNTPIDVEVPTEDQLKDTAFDWSSDYKPWQEDLEYREYARHGFVGGAQWAFRQMIEGNLSDLP